MLNEQQTRQQGEDDGVDGFATGVAVFRDGKLLVVRRAAGDTLGGHYELPGGGVDEGETIYEGAVRELAEESGLAATKMLLSFAGFDYITGSQKFIRQCNFIVEASGEVILDPNEHDHFMWIDQVEIDSLVVSDKQKICLYNAFKAQKIVERKSTWV